MQESHKKSHFPHFLRKWSESIRTALPSNFLNLKQAYYKGSTHISFMDHGYINPSIPSGINEPYFNGTLAERMEFLISCVEIFWRF